MPDYEVQFQIGLAFPESDLVARYLTVLAMMHNDWKRTMESMNAAVGQSEGEGIKLLRDRQLVGHAHEATTFLNGAKDVCRRSRVSFDGLPAPVLEQYRKVFSALDGFEDWLGTHRDITFHYPEMWPERYAAGQDPIADALTKAATDVSSVTLGPKYSDLRFDFADAVAIYLLGFDVAGNEEDREAFSRLTVALRESQWALGEFVRLAIENYLPRQA